MELENRLEGALDNWAQQSDNIALTCALQRFIQHLTKYAQCSPPLEDDEEHHSQVLAKGKTKTQKWPHSEAFQKLSSAYLRGMPMAYPLGHLGLSPLTPQITQIRMTPHAHWCTTWMMHWG
ncbi:hypothetical protein NDU88_008506 [Pleurodeles waltl]|uniref:Uncharacterized protein n=1 Tax=Pleurodeles waltl TaxID=8319 RepID=A0AAV7P0G5_PLEWA|nr:hypothetical protein NDU88_008506 [Pleurodeles waltl]